MIAFLNDLKKEHSDNDKILMSINEIENALTSKKYGLMWEKHEEDVDVKMKTNIPVFTEIKSKEISTAPNDLYNFLIEGDNLLSLRLLEKTLKGKIDLIYIDPPYNRGSNDFVYDDKFVNKDDLFKHSKWLSFMEKRLRIAYSLLTDNGMMFLSIDDNEQAALKNLMDEIFGEDNFIITLPRITKKSGKTTGSFSKNHDYVLVYTRRNKNIFMMQEHIDPEYKYEDEWVAARGKYKLNQTLDYDSLTYSTSMDYPLTVNGKTYYPGTSIEAWKERQKGNHKRADWAWRWKPKHFEFGYNNGFVVINTKKDGTSRIYTKTYVNAKIVEDSNGNYYIDYKHKTKPMSSIDLINNIYSNDNAKKDLAEFGLSDEFDYSKPVELIKILMKNHFNKDAIVLDFFAGSGTTAQAVLELNHEDGGHRRFILCNNNQNQICEKITYPRCRDVILSYDYEKSAMETLLEQKINIRDLGKPDLPNLLKQVKKENKGKFDKFKTEIRNSYLYLYGISKYEKMHGIPANLKYYVTDYIPKNEELLSDILLRHTAEMIQIENGIKLDGKHYIMILSDEEADQLSSHWDDYPDVKALYISRDVLLTSEQIKLFKDINIHTIPDCYFNFELQEAGETW